MNNLLNEKWLDELPAPIVDNMLKQNAEVIKVICERIKYFGNLRPTEIHKLSNSIAFAGADLKQIEKIIRKYTNLNAAEVRRIFEQAAKENDKFAEQYYTHRGLAPVKYTEDSYLTELLRAIEKNTLDSFENLSQTYGFKFPGQKFSSIRQTYTSVIDKAIYEVQNGILDYNTALRQAVKNLADSGIRTVNWESGISKRADSAARMNILDGVRRLNQQMMLYHGEKFGYDGVELSAHAISAPDHVAVQGHQFSNEEFQKMQEGQSCTDVNGRTYDGFKRPIGEWNCRHFVLPIIIGVSEPAYTNEQLAKMRQNSAQNYDATQEMRKRETELRRLKDRRIAFSAAGNSLEAQRCQREITIKQKEYNTFCANHGLSPQPERTQVEGYKKISIKELKNYENKGIIKTSKQFGKKIGKHASDFGLDPTSETDRRKMEQILDDIYFNHTEPIKTGKWRGQEDEVLFYIKNEDVLILKKDRQFVTVLKGGADNGRVKDARKY